MAEGVRNKAIDITKAIGIILVVIGHIPGLYNPVWKAIYSFHMPLFFIMGGAVYVQREPIEVVKRSAKALLIPYLFTIGICVLMAYLFGNTERVESYYLGLLFPDGCRSNYTLLANWPHVGALWFVPVLLSGRVLYSIICKYCRKYILAICAFAQLCAVLIGRYLCNLPLGILGGCSVLFFFAIGKSVINFNIERRDIKLLVLLLILNIWLLEIKYSSFAISLFYYKSSTYIIDVFVAISLTWLLYRMSRYLEKSKVLNMIGRETLLIFCCHEIVRQLIFNLEFQNISFGEYKGAVCLVGGTAILSMLAIGIKYTIINRKQTIEICKK